MVSRVIPVDSFDLVVFGGTGDLARRKILPGLYRRFLAGQMTAESRIIGAARAAMDDAGFRARFAGSPIKRIGRNRFVRNVLYAIGNAARPDLAPYAAACVNDADPAVADAAVWALGRLRP